VAKRAKRDAFLVSCSVSAMTPSIQDITAKSIDNQFTDINIPVQYLRTAKDQSRSLPSQLAAKPMDNKTWKTVCTICIAREASHSKS